MPRVVQIGQLLGFLLLVAGAVFAYQAGFFGRSMDATRFIISLAIGSSFYLTAFRFLDGTMPGKPKPKLMQSGTLRQDFDKNLADELDMLHASRGAYLNDIRKAIKGAGKDRKKKQSDSVHQMLLRAGYRGPRAVRYYTMAKFVSPMLGGLVGLMVAITQLGDITHMAVAVAGFSLVASMGVDSFLKKKAKKRFQALEETFPDVLELFMIGVFSGLSIDRTIERVLIELTERDVEVREELKTLLTDLRLMDHRSQAYDALIERANVPIIIALATMLKQSDAYGTPIGDALEELAEDSRKQRLHNAEKKAARIPVISLIPMVLFILPSLFIIILGPAIISISNALAW